jgi:hypothetical protein
LGLITFLWDFWLREAWVVLVKNLVLSGWGGVMERQFAVSAALCREEMFVAWQGIGIVADKEAAHLDVLVRRRSLSSVRWCFAALDFSQTFRRARIPAVCQPITLLRPRLPLRHSCCQLYPHLHARHIFSIFELSMS